jgi:hypothetical protein
MAMGMSLSGQLSAFSNQSAINQRSAFSDQLSAVSSGEQLLGGQLFRLSS